MSGGGGVAQLHAIRFLGKGHIWDGGERSHSSVVEHMFCIWQPVASVSSARAQTGEAWEGTGVSVGSRLSPWHPQVESDV